MRRDPVRATRVFGLLALVWPLAGLLLHVPLPIVICSIIDVDRAWIRHGIKFGLDPAGS